MKNSVALNLVVAMAQNQVIGREGGLPWRLPKDLAYFKRVTMGHPILMGRKTFESIGRPLPGRQNIVLTRQSDWSVDGVEVVPSLEGLLECFTAPGSDSQLMVIGGAEIYRQCLPLADRLYITEVHDMVEGDTYFPDVDWNQWSEIERENHSADENNPYAYSFVVYERT